MVQPAMQTASNRLNPIPLRLALPCVWLLNTAKRLIREQTRGEAGTGVIAKTQSIRWRMTQHKYWCLVMTIPVGMTCGLMTLLIAVLVSTAVLSPRDYTDPLGTLDTLINNDYLAVLRLYPDECPYKLGPQSTGERISCRINPDTGPLRSIEVTLHNRIIEQVQVTVDGLRVSDLVHRWGRPDQIVKTAQTYSLLWHNHISAMVSTPSNFTYQASVKFIALY